MKDFNISEIGHINKDVLDTALSPIEKELYLFATTDRQYSFQYIANKFGVTRQWIYSKLNAMVQSGLITEQMVNQKRGIHKKIRYLPKNDGYSDFMISFLKNLTYEDNREFRIHTMKQLCSYLKWSEFRAFKQLSYDILKYYWEHPTEDFKTIVEKFYSMKNSFGYKRMIKKIWMAKKNIDKIEIM